MAPMGTKRRQAGDYARPKKKKVKHIKRQKRYHSSSEDEDDDGSAMTGQQRASDAPKPRPEHTTEATLPVVQPKSQKKPSHNPKPILKQSQPAPQPKESSEDGGSAEDLAMNMEVDELEKNTALNALLQDRDDDESDSELDAAAENDEPDLEDISENDDDDDDEDADDDDDDNDDIPSESEASVTSSQALRPKKKRNDPTAFATSISKILDTKLSTAKRHDPVLSRSKSAAEATQTLADTRLEQRARAQMRAEKRAGREKGRVRDVLGLETAEVDTGAAMEVERRLKKTAQRGVVRLFNAVRAAQVQADEARRNAQAEGIVGVQQREQRATEMSKQGFLDLISAGGKPKPAPPVSG